MRQRKKKELLIVFFMMLVGGAVGAAYSYVVYLSQDNAEGSVWTGVAIGVVISGASAIIEIFFISRPESKIRTMPVLISLIVRVLLQLAVIILTLILVQYIITHKFNGPSYLILDGDYSSTLTDILFSFLVISIIIFNFQMRNFIGGRTLTNLMLGRYYRPRIEECIFMIVDTVGSTAVAQKIGDEKFHAYLNRLFILFDQPINEFGGEVHSYVGDAILVVWPLSKNKKRNARIFQTLKAMQDVCLQKSEEITAKYGIPPQIHAAVHAGAIAVGEMGMSKRQITYLGNTLNLTFRIESIAKEQGIPSRFIISDELLEKCELPQGINAQSIGSRKLKGSQSPLMVSALILDSEAVSV